MQPRTFKPTGPGIFRTGAPVNAILRCLQPGDSLRPIYLDVYGGTNAYTAQVVTVNGHALNPMGLGAPLTLTRRLTRPRPSLWIGHRAMAVAVSSAAAYLRKDGSANNISVLVSDPSNTGFDGRMVEVSLMAVYQDPNISEVGLLPGGRRWIPSQAPRESDLCKCY